MILVRCAGSEPATDGLTVSGNGRFGSEAAIGERLLSAKKEKHFAALAWLAKQHGAMQSTEHIRFWAIFIYITTVYHTLQSPQLNLEYARALAES